MRFCANVDIYNIFAKKCRRYFENFVMKMYVYLPKQIFFLKRGCKKKGFLCKMSFVKKRKHLRQMCLENMTMSALVHNIQQTVTAQFVVKQKPIPGRGRSGQSSCRGGCSARTGRRSAQRRPDQQHLTME